jgi:hypothetical protein
MPLNQARPMLHITEIVAIDDANRLNRQPFESS